MSFPTGSDESELEENVETEGNEESGESGNKGVLVSPIENGGAFNSKE